MAMSNGELENDFGINIDSVFGLLPSHAFNSLYIQDSILHLLSADRMLLAYIGKKKYSRQ